MSATERVIDKERFFRAIGYTAHPKQRLYHASQSRFKVVVAGRRFGKSLMAARDLEPELFIPGRKYWIVGPNYELGSKEFNYIWQDLIVGQKLGQDRRTKKSFNKQQGAMFIQLPWNTSVEVKSAQRPDGLVGEGLHGVIMAEAAKHSHDTWERYIRPALGDYKGWAAFVTTPEGQNYLHKFWQFGRNPNPEYTEYSSFHFPSWDNPVLYPGGREDPEILKLELEMSPEWFAQEIGADFTAFVGRIYKEFQEDTHVQALKYNPAWQNYLLVDFGFVNPFCALDVQVDPWDNVYVWREHYASFKTLADHIDIMRNREQPPGYRIDAAFADAADPEGAATISQLYTPCVTDPAAKENWREGIELVKLFLKEFDTGLYDEYGRPILKPKLYVDFSCVNTIREFNNYRAQESARTARNKQSPREKAQNVDDHALDALRYGLMHLYHLGARHHLSEVMDSSPTSAPSGASTVSNDGGIFQMSSMEF